MFAFSRAILLMSVRARDMVSNANASKKGVEGLIFTPPIRLNCQNFTIKLTFNKILKILKALKNFRLMANEI
jgi:hypothetical protein